jgi:hypothetical protein
MLPRLPRFREILSVAGSLTAQGWKAWGISALQRQRISSLKSPLIRQVFIGPEAYIGVIIPQSRERMSERELGAYGRKLKLSLETPANLTIGEGGSLYLRSPLQPVSTLNERLARLTDAVAGVPAKRKEASHGKPATYLIRNGQREGLVWDVAKWLSRTSRGNWLPQHLDVRIRLDSTYEGRVLSVDGCIFWGDKTGAVIRASLRVSFSRDGLSALSDFGDPFVRQLCSGFRRLGFSICPGAGRDKASTSSAKGSFEAMAIKADVPNNQILKTSKSVLNLIRLDGSHRKST